MLTWLGTTGKQRKNRQKTLRGTAKVKGAKAKKEK
jgi:small subunit ribosomal protein S24e